MDESRRCLEAFLLENDPAKLWGGLTRVSLEDGQVLFCCRACLTEGSSAVLARGRVVPGQASRSRAEAANASAAENATLKQRLQQQDGEIAHLQGSVELRRAEVRQLEDKVQQLEAKVRQLEPAVALVANQHHTSQPAAPLPSISRHSAMQHPVRYAAGGHAARQAHSDGGAATGQLAALMNVSDQLLATVGFEPRLENMMSQPGRQSQPGAATPPFTELASLSRAPLPLPPLPPAPRQHTRQWTRSIATLPPLPTSRPALPLLLQGPLPFLPSPPVASKRGST